MKIYKIQILSGLKTLFDWKQLSSLSLLTMLDKRIGINFLFSYLFTFLLYYTSVCLQSFTMLLYFSQHSFVPLFLLCYNISLC